MSFGNAVFSGAPSSAVNASSRQANLGLDQDSGTLYFTGPNTDGWTAVPNASSNASSIDGVTVTGTPSAGQAIVATSASAAHWAAPPTTGFSGTIVTAQLTPSTGTQGSITVVNGVITAVVAAT